MNSTKNKQHNGTASRCIRKTIHIKSEEKKAYNTTVTLSPDIISAHGLKRYVKYIKHNKLKLQ